MCPVPISLALLPLSLALLPHSLYTSLYFGLFLLHRFHKVWSLLRYIRKTDLKAVFMDK